MVMLRARKTNVPPAFLNMALKEESPVREIRSKNVITGVWTCPAFAMYLSDKCKCFILWPVHPPPASEVSPLVVIATILIDTLLRAPVILASEHVKIALRAAHTESGRETGWHAEGNVGVYQFGSLPNGEYIPLYQLQTIRTKSLRRNPDGEGKTETM